MRRLSHWTTLLYCALLTISMSAVHADSPPAEWTTKSVHSKDGTRIVYHTAGKGTPLIIVHGGWSSAEAYKPLGKALEADYQVVLLERRNYGVSDTGPTPHVFARDGEDIHAVIAALGRDSYLFGHSGGGIASLYAVLSGTKGIRKLAVYEPPLSAGGPGMQGVLDRYKNFLAENRLEAAVLLGLTDLIGYPESVARQMAPVYLKYLQAPQLNGAVHDVEGLRSMNPDAAQWAHLRLPVLLIVGEKSNEHPLLDSSRALLAAVPRAQLVTLAGQEHRATALAPERVAEQLRKFFVP